MIYWGPTNCSLTPSPQNKQNSAPRTYPLGRPRLKISKKPKRSPQCVSSAGLAVERGQRRSPVNFYQQKSTHFHTARLRTSMLQEGSGATSDPAQGSPRQSRETLSQFDSAGSEGSSNELKSQNQATWTRATSAGPATRGGSSLPTAPRSHLRRLRRGCPYRRPGVATLRRCPLAGASGVSGLGRSCWAWGMSGQRRIAAAWVPRGPLC